MSPEYIILSKIPTGNVHLRATAATDGIQFKAGGFKYYQIHKTGTKSRRHFPQSGKEKALQPSIKDWRRTRSVGQGELKQTKNEHDFLTILDYSLFLPCLTKPKLIQTLFHFFIYITTTGHATNWPKTALYQLCTLTLGTLYPDFLPSV